MGQRLRRGRQGRAASPTPTSAPARASDVAGFLPDGDGETVPSTVDGILYPVHPLQITAMGMLAADSLDLEDLAEACAAEHRWEFMVGPGAAADPEGHRIAFQPDRCDVTGGGRMTLLLRSQLGRANLMRRVGRLEQAFGVCW